MEVPDTEVAEIIDGELIVSPRPASPHAHAATVIGGDLVADAVRAQPFDAVELRLARWRMPRSAARQP